MTSQRDSLTDYQIVVTGAAGFIGRRVVRRLLAEDAYVIAVDLVGFPSEFNKLFRGKGVPVERVGDLNSPQFANQAIKEVNAGGRSHSALIHLSGSTHVGQCEANPMMAYEANVIQTIQVLEACRKHGVTRVLFPSTVLVYGLDAAHVLTEKCPPNPKTIYTSTKLAAEAVIQGYAGSYSFSCDITRLSNVYGAGANPDTAVSTALRQAKRGGAITLRNLKPVRDFIYCEDVAEGFVRLLTSGQEPGCRIFNLSTGQATSIGEMAKIVCEVAGIRNEIVESNLDDAPKESRLVLANDKLVRRTAWRPAFSLSEGLGAAWEEMNS